MHVSQIYTSIYRKWKKKGWGDVGWVMHAENDDDGNASVCKDSNDDDN